MPTRTLRILVNGARKTRRRGPGICRGCQRRIFWVAGINRKPVPMDDVPEVIALSGDVETVSADYAHWNTCADRDRFRRDRQSAETRSEQGLFEN